MNIGWQHYRAVAEGAPGGAHPGIVRGYFNLAFYLHRALSALPGVSVADALQGEAAHPKIALHLCPPHIFRPIPGKTNVVFSMWEGGALPREIVAGLGLADRCIVPSRYCQQVWNRHGLGASVVQLGIAPAFAACDPTRPLLQTARALRFLWLGSKLERKGWGFLAKAWQLAFSADNAELYVKTIGDSTLQEHFSGTVTIDQRDLDGRELVELYRSADVFVFPSYGEGFGLPALEAMATGCLVIAPAFSGLTEFVSPQTALVLELGKEVTAHYGDFYRARFPTAQGLAVAMKNAYRMWGMPGLERVRTNGTELARCFTWNRTAEQLVEALGRMRAGVTREEEVPLAV